MGHSLGVGTTGSVAVVRSSFRLPLLGNARLWGIG